MGTKQKQNPRQCQLEAYVAVLKALSVGKLDWVSACGLVTGICGGVGGGGM